MDGRLAELAEAIERWRGSDVDDYWLRVSYIGAAVNRFGDHELTCVGGTLWHCWEGAWRQIAQGSDFWLFSVPGAFAWARDLITRVVPEHDLPAGALTIEYDGQMGFVRTMHLDAAQRDAHNFSFEVRQFGTGVHPDFDAS